MSFTTPSMELWSVSLFFFFFRPNKVSVASSASSPSSASCASGAAAKRDSSSSSPSLPARPPSCPSTSSSTMKSLSASVRCSSRESTEPCGLPSRSGRLPEGAGLSSSAVLRERRSDTFFPVPLSRLRFFSVPLSFSLLFLSLLFLLAPPSAASLRLSCARAINLAFMSVGPVLAGAWEPVPAAGSSAAGSCGSSSCSSSDACSSDSTAAPG
mmetsp:Transcript_5642/g.9841  ORF Transcript_5642/g.9841 Transcript_5642/m.9841 type:complete len:212 (+) Transcript_5642:1622-2257(+)